MKKIATVILSGLLTVFSCNQDPIFFKISTETEPKKPHIPGAPTKMVVFQRNGIPIMYVASGRLHWYTKKGIAPGVSGWDSESAGYKIEQPGGKIIDLAVTAKYLYALSISSSGATTTLRRIGHAEDTWTEISAGTSRFNSIQTIFADPVTNRLFAGAFDITSVVYPSTYIDYGILSLDDSTATTELNLLDINNDNSRKNSELLSGAAFLDDTYYLCTRGNDSSNSHTGGVFMITQADLSANKPATQVNEIKLFKTDSLENNRLFMGMIKLDDQNAIIVIERDGGDFFEVRSSGFRRIKYKNNDDIVRTGRYSTGALAVWQNVNNAGEKRFVAGIQGGLYSTTTSSSYTHGYAEFDYTFYRNGAWLEFDSTRRDTKPSETVDSLTDRYSSTIGKHPINYMYQVPVAIDPAMIFFASTQTAGLWSYRYREPDGPQWNAETEK